MKTNISFPISELLMPAKGKVADASYRGEVPASGYRSNDFVDIIDFADGSKFEFEFSERADGSWAIKIMDQPSYDGLEYEFDTHRISADDGDGYQICFGDPSEVSSKYLAKEFAHDWAIKTWKLIHWREEF